MKHDFYQKPFPNIKIDDTCHLREQVLDDTSDFYEYYSNPAVSRYILANKPQNLTEAMNEIYYCRNLFYSKNGICWAVASLPDNRMIGTIGLYINNHHNRAEICYDLGQAFWRQGIMSRVIKKTMDFAFEDIDLDRIEAVTVKENIASMAILQKLGYRYEGTLHNYRRHDNQAHDVELFAITPAQRQNFLNQKQQSCETK